MFNPPPISMFLSIPEEKYEMHSIIILQEPCQSNCRCQQLPYLLHPKLLGVNAQVLLEMQKYLLQWPLTSISQSCFLQRVIWSFNAASYGPSNNHSKSFCRSRSPSLGFSTMSLEIIGQWNAKAFAVGRGWLWRRRHYRSKKSRESRKPEEVDKARWGTKERFTEKIKPATRTRTWNQMFLSRYVVKQKPIICYKSMSGRKQAIKTLVPMLEN